MKHGIYMYWEDAGSPCNWYYSLCRDTVLNHNPGAKVLSRQDVVDVLGPIPAELDKVYVIHRVDWIRKAFIAAVGGLWLDMDFVCFKSLDALAGLAKDFDFAGYREWPGNWMDNVFAGRKGSDVLKSAADYALEVCRKNGSSVQWLATNADAINHAVEKHRWSFVLQIPTHILSPVSVMDPQWFRSDMSPTDDMNCWESFGFITSYHGLHGWISSQTKEEFLGGKSKLAALFKRALR